MSDSKEKKYAVIIQDNEAYKVIYECDTKEVAQDLYRESSTKGHMFNSGESVELIEYVVLRKKGKFKR